MSRRIPVPILVRRLEESFASAAERVRASRLAARAATCEAARRLGAPEPTFEQDELGAPRPVDGWWWSLSHSGDLVAATLHLGRVGVDVERIAVRRAALRNAVANDEEQRLFEEFDALAFTRLWTAKEAVLKAAGVGLTELSGCRLLAVEDDEHIVAGFRDTRCRVLQRRHGDYLLAVHVEGDDWSVDWDLP